MLRCAPYSPDELIELFVDGDRVVAHRLREFERPQRLTPDEGFVLAAAARGLLSVPGADEEGVLQSALGKLKAALGSAPLAVELDQPEHLQALQDATRDRQQVEIEYFSSSGCTADPAAGRSLPGRAEGRPLVPRRLVSLRRRSSPIPDRQGPIGDTFRPEL